MIDRGDRPSRPFGDAISRALGHEVDGLELLSARAWQVLSAAVCLITLVVTIVIRPGYGALAVAIALLCWSTFAIRALKRGRWRTSLMFIALTIEASAPWAILLAVVVAQGPVDAYHHALFGPMLFFAGTLLLSAMRLNPRTPLYTGAVAAIEYLVVSLVVAPATSTQEELAAVGLQPVHHVVRAVFLLIGSGVGSFAAYALRRAVGGTVRRVRALDLFGKYQLERELASGGMGVVWLASYCPEGGFRRPAALKKIHAHLAKEQTFVDAFRREAELGARLVHHNIVQVLDFGRVDDTYFLAMEYVDGMSLFELMTRAAQSGLMLPPNVVALIGREVLAGLQFAHAEARDADGAVLRVVHRDLAPQNVLVSKTGLVKISDFGIARTLRDSTSAVTHAVGHAGHVAPEHVDGKPIDGRSDLFLVGVLLWEMLCGRSLFLRDNDTATLSALLLQPALAPSSVDARLRPWDAFLLKALEKSPDARYASAADMRRALDDVTKAVGVAAPEELGGLVRALSTGDVHSAPTMKLGGAIGKPSDDVTAVER